MRPAPDPGAGLPGFADAVLEIVEHIPPGQVATYGDIAALLGSRGARVVGRVMALYGSDVPWWRVVRAGGLPPREHEERALPHYRDEGTPLVMTAEGYRVATSARWRPTG
ncbi:MGMT family protein [Rathayibacter sp. YIM 133350]|uniref:MGMT family protein n=1 Tax=Rathayibacter sp. YIM 133350 TaxID=3131992 RepID=UPI00307D4D37